MSLARAVLCTGLVWAAVASAETTLTRAEARYQQAVKAAKALEYDRALALTVEAFSLGEATASLTRALLALQAEMAIAVDLPETAVTAYARLLELEPAWQRPVDASPRTAEPFRQAAKKVAGARLTAVPTSTRTADGQAYTRVRIEGDVLNLVHGGRVETAGPSTPLTRTDVLEARWRCTQPACEYTVSLTDSQGNELLRLGDDGAPLAVPAALPTGDTRPLLRRGWPYVALAGALAIVGTVLAVRTAQLDAEFRIARDTPGQYTYFQVSALDAQRRGWYAGAVTGFSLTVLAAALGAWWWLP
ncbi:MAG: hypothetical protein IPJ65_35335 [Archangiaceae bacterium]|nr:hypothetical protein [Archangiaceae bacterium]